MPIVHNDPFHPGELRTVLIDPNEIASGQMMGYGVLYGKDTPVVRLIYKNGTAEDVFDAYGQLLER